MDAKKEKKLYQETFTGFSYGYVEAENQPAADLRAYPYKNENDNPKKIRIQLSNANGEMVLFMPFK